MKKPILLRLLLFVWFLANLSWADDLFAPFLTDTPPKIVEVISKTEEDGVEVTRLKFLNRRIPNIEDGEVLIYGILARPMKPGKHPGILVCHGGGGYADMVAPAVIGWAKRDYVAFCQDEPGICNRSKSRSTGPWEKRKWSTFTVDPDPTCSMLFDGVAAALNGLAILRSQPDVDTSRIGVFGGSWGGYMTTMVSGLAGDRVRASFSVYGCGYYDIGSTWIVTLEGMGKEQAQKWLDCLDAGRRAAGIRSNYFITPAANDWFFWPPAVMATYGKISSPKNIAFSPNDSHRICIPGGTSGPQSIDRAANRTYMEILWMDYHLKGEGKPFPVCEARKDARRKGMDIEVRFNVKGPLPIKSATVWHSFGETPWRTRWWVRTEAKAEADNTYSALLPVYETECPINWLGLVTDERDITVSTTMQEVDPLTLGFKPAERRDHVFGENFETSDAMRKWQKPYAHKYENAKHAICKEAAHSGGLGLSIVGKMMVRFDGLRGEMLRRSGSKGFSFWVRSPKETAFDVLLMGEHPNGSRAYWRAAQKNPGIEWKKMDVLWEDFKFQGKEQPPFEMLSARLGQLRFSTPENAEIHIDDISTIPREGATSR